MVEPRLAFRFRSDSVALPCRLAGAFAGGAAGCAKARWPARCRQRYESARQAANGDRGTSPVAWWPVGGELPVWAFRSKKHSCVRTQKTCVRAQNVDLYQKKWPVLKYAAIF